ncbi:hypothetical protein [Flavobacterium succinicans]|uniref:Lipoprotein n=1 Tax=Flavobacterium succinicans TaxID=29536 RepID=A0A199XUY9_9FLAO|nr:hypothetical protein [Flavobacterium succinicans]OAZ05588.1 hypothetical protein FLB_00010 [Flavobacterium succinicans]
MKNISIIFLLLFLSCSKKENLNNDWREINTKDSIPKQLSNVLLSINGNLKIANPNEDFEATDNIVNENLPIRQLKLLAVKNNEWRLSYIQGGIGTSYFLIECTIKNDSLYNLKIANSLLDLDNNDSISKFIKQGKIKYQRFEKAER